MTRFEAVEAMKQGHKVTHQYFASNEYLYMDNGVITSEDGYDFDRWLLGTLTPGTVWRDTGWRIKE